MPNADLFAIVHDEQKVDAGDCAGSVRDDNDNAIACANVEDRAGQGVVAFGIKI